MTGAALAQLLVTLSPLLKEGIVEGGKLIATFRDNLTQSDINKALEASRSSSWPELTFAPPVAGK